MISYLYTLFQFVRFAVYVYSTTTFKQQTPQKRKNWIYIYFVFNVIRYCVFFGWGGGGGGVLFESCSYFQLLFNFLFNENNFAILQLLLPQTRLAHATCTLLTRGHRCHILLWRIYFVKGVFCVFVHVFCQRCVLYVWSFICHIRGYEQTHLFYIIRNWIDAITSWNWRDFFIFICS